MRANWVFKTVLSSPNMPTTTRCSKRWSYALPRTESRCRLSHLAAIADEIILVNGHYDAMEAQASQPETTGKTPETAPPKPPGKSPAPAHKPRKPWLLTVISLLIAVLAVAGCIYLWKTLETLKTQTLAGTIELRKSLRALDEHPAIIELKQRLAEQDAKLNEEFTAQRARIGALQEAFEVTRQVINRDQRGWILAEVEYLIRVAITRLRLMQDIKGSTEALVVADQRLGDLGDPATLRIREKLAVEITSLKSLYTPDTDGAALKLLSIGNRLHLLPNTKRPATDRLPDAATVDSSSQASTSFLGRVWSGLLSTLGVRRVDAPVSTSILRNDLYYTEQLLRLEIESARQAILRLDKADFEKRLITARSLLDEHYDRNNEQVILLKADLSVLLEANLFPTLPDISGSLGELMKLQQQYRPVLIVPDE
jgi:uroporphyrin-3 C-methyltransferase